MTGTGPVVATPLAIERRALAGPGDARVPTAEVVTTGAGPRRSREAARRLAGRPVLVAGVAGALVDGVRPGDLVVADEVRRPGSRPVRPASAPLLAAALRAAGLRVHVGPVVSADHVVTGAERAALARPAAACEEGFILTSGGSDGPSLATPSSAATARIRSRNDGGGSTTGTADPSSVVTSSVSATMRRQPGQSPRCAAKTASSSGSRPCSTQATASSACPSEDAGRGALMTSPPRPRGPRDPPAGPAGCGPR